MRNILSRALSASLLLVCACALHAAERLSESALRTTSAGHTFTAPAGFVLQARGSATVLEAPEGDAHLALVDVARAASHEDALAAGWAAYRAGVRPRPLRVTREEASQDGWSATRTYIYEVSPNEKLDIRAQVRRSGDAWVVLILEAAEATLEKRAGPITAVFASLRPRGATREMFTGRAARPVDDALVAAMRRFVEEGVRELGLPGAAFSLVQDGRVVYEGGVGVRELGKPQRIDADTLFMAGSNTKSMTSLLVAQAVDAGLLAWDQPVREAYPRFRLGSSELAGRVLVKHLLCACTGLPRQDMEWLFASDSASPDTVFDMLATMEPTTKFGEAFQYSNLMAGSAGYVAASRFLPGRELGAAYDTAMRERIFAPLGMHRSTFDNAQAEAGNHAAAHWPDADGRMQVASMALNRTIRAARPAGGLWTSAHDMSRYVLLELGRGELAGGPRIVSRRSLLAREEPQALVGEDMHYGLALFVNRRWGVDIVGHAGDLAGYHSAMFWLPSHGIGATLLTNGGPGWLLRGPFQRKLLELVFEGRAEADGQLQAAARNFYETMRKDRERLRMPPDPDVAATLAPRYANPALGTVSVRRTDGALEVTFGTMTSRMASRRNDDGSVSLVSVTPGVAGFEFVVAAQGAERRLVLRSAQQEYVFAGAP